MNEQMIMITLDKIAEKFGVSVENLIGAVLETRIMLLGVLIVCLAVIFILMGVFVYFCKFKKISDKYEFEIFCHFCNWNYYNYCLCSIVCINVI